MKRIRNEHYPSEEAFALDLARVMNPELRELVRAGATDLQIDEPYYSGFPEDLPWGIPAVNELVEGVEAHVTLHICYGNRYGKPSLEGSYRYLFPAILDAQVQTVSLEFARRGEDDLRLFKEFDVPFALGLGVIDVKTHDVESPASWPIGSGGRSRSCPPSGSSSIPTAACVHLPRDVAFSKLCAMVEGARSVREELGAMTNRSPRRSGAAVLLRGRSWWPRASSARRRSSRSPRSWRRARYRRRQRHELRRRRFGQDPCASAPPCARAGCTPNVHLTCVGEDRHGLRKTLEELQRARHRQRVRADRRLAEDGAGRTRRCSTSIRCSSPS